MFAKYTQIITWGGVCCILFLGCSSPNRNSVLSFEYSLWKVDNKTQSLIDVGCIDAKLDRIRVDLLLQGVQVGGGDALCNAFGNEDTTSIAEELGEFIDEFSPATFNEIRISLFSDEGELVPFGLRLDGNDTELAIQQTISFSNFLSLDANSELMLSIPGDPAFQIAQEMQMILPP